MKSGGIDPAALAAATLAGALSLMGPEGPYKPPSMVMGGTLLALLYGYDFEPDRGKRQSVAFSAVSGLCWMLFLGFPLEYIFSGMKVDDSDSIPPYIPFVIWLVAGTVTFLIDRYRAKDPWIMRLIGKSENKLAEGEKSSEKLNA